jgi:hypothetical protein
LEKDGHLAGVGAAFVAEKERETRGVAPFLADMAPARHELVVGYGPLKVGTRAKDPGKSKAQWDENGGGHEEPPEEAER